MKGKKVVAIHDWSTFIIKPRYQGEILPIKGEIYTVREVISYKDGTIGYKLEEIVNTPRPYVHDNMVVEDECDFDSRAFRPVEYTFGKNVAESIEEQWIPLCHTLAKIGY